MSKYSELRDLINGLETDFNKFYEQGNKAAGTRVRKAMLDLKAKAQEIRTEIVEKKSA